MESPRSKLMSDDSFQSVDYHEPGSSSLLATFLGSICFPLTLTCSWFCVQEQEEAVILSFGKYTGIRQDPGVHFANCFGREIRRVSKRKTSIDLPNTKVIDFNGNPLLVSGIVVYYFVNSKRAAIDMTDAAQFVSNQAQAVLKQVVSQFPYEHLDSTHSGPCLKTESGEVGEKFVQLLQSKVNIAGAKVLSFQFNEISYAPEIASGMLKKQQAMAMVAARKTIVDGAVEIAYGAIEKLEKRGIGMDDHEKTRIVGNLLTVICSESNVQPTINVV